VFWRKCSFQAAEEETTRNRNMLSIPFWKYIKPSEEMKPPNNCNIKEGQVEIKYVTSTTVACIKID
jgi:hypothetical protein